MRKMLTSLASRRVLPLLSLTAKEDESVLVIIAGAVYSAEESPSPWYFQHLSILIIKLCFPLF